MVKKLYLALIVIGACCPVLISGLYSNYSGYLGKASVLGFFFVLFLEYRLTRRPFITCFCFGFIVSGFRLDAIIKDQLDPELEGRTLILTGYPVSAGSNSETYQRFQFRIDSAVDNDGNRQPKLHGKKIRLSWKTPNRMSPGKLYRLSVRLKRPRGMVNPGGFDYQAWLLSRHIVATGYVRSGDLFEEQSQAMHFAQQPFIQRQKFLDTLDTVLAELEYKRIIRALVAGQREGLTAKDWQLFQQTGTVHLMAISGLHIGLIAGVAALIPLTLGRVFNFAVSFEVSRYVATIFALGTASVYAWLAGFSVPTLRALLMVSAFGFSCFAARNTSAMHVLLLVAIALVFSNPIGLTQPGFVLSFSAVAFLIFCFSGRINTARRLVDFLRAQWVLLIGLFAILIAFSLPVALLAPVANSIAVPLVSCIVLPLLFFATLMLFINEEFASLVFTASDFVLQGLFAFLQWSAQWELKASIQQLISPNSALMLFVAVVLILAPRTIGLRPLGLLLVGIVYFPLHKTPPPTLTVLDVGQGLSIVLQIDKSTLVYDLGAAYSDDFSMATRVVTPFLRQQGVKQVDQLWLSHADNDHAGDLSGFLRSNKVGALYSGEPEKLLPIEISHCGKVGETLLHSALEIKILWPNLDDERSATEGLGLLERSNNRSCVLLIRYQDKHILLTGDIEAKVERHLLENGVLPKNVDLLIAPHHGSNTSSTAAFVRRVNPKQVVFSSGYKNRYRHPAEKVTRRYQSAGAVLWSTAHCGALVFDLDSPALTPAAERMQNRKPWYLQQGLCH